MVCGHWSLESSHEVAYRKATASRNVMLTPLILAFKGDMSGASELSAQARKIERSQRSAVRLQRTLKWIRLSEGRGRWMAGSFEHSDETASFIKGGKCVYQMSDGQRL
jgi:hypothetical protein